MVRRGRVQPVRVIIDEVPVVFGGLDWLRSYDAGEIYLMEVYDLGRAIRVLTRWAVDERPEQLAALRMLPVAPLLDFRGRSGRSLGWGDAGPPVFSRGSRPGSLGLTDFD